jgi:hypothetical protein
MNPYYRQEVTATLTLALIEVYAEVAENPEAPVEREAMLETARFGYTLLKSWSIAESEHDAIVSEALSSAGLTSE